MVDPAAEGSTEGETYAAFVQTADELEWRIDLLAREIRAGKEGSHG
jgi:hypothetical protein